jgi:hypothetical protein
MKWLLAEIYKKKLRRNKRTNKSISNECDSFFKLNISQEKRTAIINNKD